MKRLITFIWLLGMSMGYSQSIINTESILKDIDSTSTINFNIDGDLKYGNIKLIELNVLQLKEVGDFEAQNFQPARNFD